ncbi:MAG: DUF2064 domain-containing protein, partial [Actinobacteria bacterium]|nr:DUF2064 domain-containing protein [Actinomycetota bacterium]
AALVVLAKRPAPGRVKTRLCPPFTPAEAADLAAAALRDTVETVAAADAPLRVLAFDGDPRGWRPPGWRHVAQPDGPLGRRIAAALGAADRPAVLVGMDTPQLTVDHLAAADLRRFDACLGPAADGGYWALGLADPRVAPAALRGVPMSTEVTADRQLRRLRELGLRVQLLDELTDVDTAESARTVAAEAPWTRFARHHRELLEGEVA